MVGPCTMFGPLVDDSHTIGNNLQKILYDYGFNDYEVIICSVSGTLSPPRLFVEEIGEQDIVVLMSSYYDVWKKYETSYSNRLHCLESMAQIWHEIDRPVDHVLNMAEHCDYIVQRKIAEKIFDDLKGVLNKNGFTMGLRSRLQDYFISWDIICYYKKHFLQYGESRNGTVGAAVMNCNPFTKGHYYLIEQASKQVDYVYVFVVEEDKSEFTFQERFELVRKGTEGLENVKVIPSGEYVISSKTFEQYFQKDNVSEIKDMSYDIRIFGEVVAKEYGIKYRFVGEEPYDAVTAEYNEAMKRILPQYGIDVIELARIKDKENDVISASKVRKYFRENNCDKLKGMLPISTYQWIEEKSKTAFK